MPQIVSCKFIYTIHSILFSISTVILCICLGSLGHLCSFLSEVLDAESVHLRHSKSGGLCVSFTKIQWVSILGKTHLNGRCQEQQESKAEQQFRTIQRSKVRMGRWLQGEGKWQNTVYICIWQNTVYRHLVSYLKS